MRSFSLLCLQVQQLWMLLYFWLLLMLNAHNLKLFSIWWLWKLWSFNIWLFCRIKSTSSLRMQKRPNKTISKSRNSWKDQFVKIHQLFPFQLNKNTILMQFANLSVIFLYLSEICWWHLRWLSLEVSMWINLEQVLTIFKEVWLEEVSFREFYKLECQYSLDLDICLKIHKTIFNMLQSNLKLYLWWHKIIPFFTLFLEALSLLV